MVLDKMLAICLDLEQLSSRCKTPFKNPEQSRIQIPTVVN